MSSRTTIGAGAAIYLALLLVGCSSTGGDTGVEPMPPDIIFLLTDDHRWDALGAAGHPIAHTPHIDALAQGGVRFANAYVTTPICATSRASFFTGQYARRHGIHDFATNFTPQQLGATYPVLLREAGYWSGFIGKWGVGNALPDSVFDYWRGLPGQPRYETTDEDGRPIHHTRLVGNQAVDFLENLPPDRPFHLSISFKAPHVQDGDPRQFIYDPAFDSLFQDVTFPVPETASAEALNALPDFLRSDSTEARIRWKLRFETPEQYQESVRGYYRLLAGVDEVLGRIRETLDRVGRADRTVILFAGDNGFFLGEHGLAGKWYGFEESIRVPLIVYDPRSPAPAGARVREEMALNIDVAPTILRLAGLVVPESVQGRDLTPLLRGETRAWREEFLFEHLFPHPRIPRSEGVVSRSHKYLRFIDREPPYEMLFDLENDPHETDNLAADEPALTAQLRSRTDSLISNTLSR